MNRSKVTQCYKEIHDSNEELSYAETCVGRGIHCWKEKIYRWKEDLEFFKHRASPVPCTGGNCYTRGSERKPKAGHILRTNKFQRSGQTKTHPKDEDDCFTPKIRISRRQRCLIGEMDPWGTERYRCLQKNWKSQRKTKWKAKK